MIKIIKVGSQITIGEDIPAIVVSVMIRENDKLSYEIVWWNGRERKSEWVTENEIRNVKPDEKEKIGFLQ